MTVVSIAPRRPGRPPRVQHTPSLSRGTERLPRIVRWLVAWQKRAEMRHRLAQMTERELDDIGLTRADLDAADARLRGWPAY